MRQFLRFKLPPLRKSWFVFLSTFFILFDAYAGDISVSLRYRIEVAMEDVEQPIVTEVSNSENFQVLGAALSLTIRDKLSLDVAYEWSTDIGTVEPQSSVTLRAPDMWTPKLGTYIMHYELTSLNDINPANDTASYELEVKPNLGLGLRFNQLNFKNPFQQEYSSTGRLDFTISPQAAQYYLNVVIGKEDGASAPQKWAVQNMPLPVFPDTQQVSYWVDLKEIGVADGDKLDYLKYDLSVSSMLWKEPQFSTKLAYNMVYESDYDVGGDNPSDIEITGSYLDVVPIDWNKDFKVVTWNYRGCTVPNIDLDSSKYNPRDMAGVVGDWNSCSPAAQTNSLQWLENTDSRIPKTGLTHREKLDLFNKLSGRANEDGLNTGNTIKGKLAYIDSLKLPIHVKWQGVPYSDSIASPNARYNHSAESKNDSVGAWCTFEWLASEMEKGEDVEIKFGWYDTMNVRHDGHWVTVSGVSDVSIARGIYVKDDQDQAKEGGTRQTYVNWVTNENGRPRLVGFKGANNRCWVESVVSESYDSTITFSPVSAKIVPNINHLNLTVYENPSSRLNPVSVGFELAQPSDVQVYIYEITGRLVFSRELVYNSSGAKTVNWDGKENNGLLSGSGIYVVKVVNGDLSETTKFIRQD